MGKLVCESLEELYGVEDIQLSPGEKRALARGQDILSREQLAALYLAAKNAEGRSEDTRGRGDTGLTRNALKINKETDTDFQKLPAPRLADVLDLNPRTVSYTLSKFRLLSQGNRIGTFENHLYDKIIKAFDEFENMPVGEVYSIAMEAVNMDATTERSEKYYDELSKRDREHRQNIKDRNHRIGVDAYSLYNDYRVPFGERAPQKVMDKISQKYNLPMSDIRTIVKGHFKNDPFLARKF